VSAAETPTGPLGRTDAPDWAHFPVPAARLTGGLLHDWQQRSSRVSLPLALRQLEAAGNLDNVRLAIEVGERSPAERPLRLGVVEPSPGSGYRGPVFMDSDIYKTLEAIGWQLGHDDDPELRAFASGVISLLEQAQLPDGYLDSYNQVTGEPRYGRLEWSHEMYCAGHLIQAAIAMRRGAGDDRLLAVAIRLADHLVTEFGGKERGLDGHPIIETALVELYRETGTRDYLELAKQFVDQRGSGLVGDSGMGRRYLQDHLPVRAAPTPVGHVVRQLYLDAGVADVAAEMADQDLLESSVRRWEDMIASKTYLTGGNGSRHADEGFGDRYELPPDRAYNETCAAIASFQWSWRLLLATGDVRYADHMERVLYNGFAASVATEGDKFFYVNPLQRREDHFEKDDPGRRRTWFSCACCPPNIMRLLASVGHYLTTSSGDTLYVQQYADTTVSGAGLQISMETGYPWSGAVRVRVLAADPGERGLAIRVPEWSAAASYRLNDEPERRVQSTGYLTLRRSWSPGDELVLELDMTPRWVQPARRVDAIRGCVAIERGPLVYCCEQADQADGVAVDDLAVIAGGELISRPVTLPGIGETIQVLAPAVELPSADPVTAVAIPYFQWDNRDGRPMRVWLPAPALSPSPSALSE